MNGLSKQVSGKTRMVRGNLFVFVLSDDDMMPLTTHMAVFYNVHVLCQLCSPQAQVPTLTNPSMTVKTLG